MLPRPNAATDPDGCGRYVYVSNADSLDQQYVTRADYQVTANKRVFFRDFLAFFGDPGAFDQNNPNLLDAVPAAATTRSSTRSQPGSTTSSARACFRPRAFRTSTLMRSVRTARACRRWGCWE